MCGLKALRYRFLGLNFTHYSVYSSKQRNLVLISLRESEWEKLTCIKLNMWGQVNNVSRGRKEHVRFVCSLLCASDNQWPFEAGNITPVFSHSEGLANEVKPHTQGDTIISENLGTGHVVKSSRLFQCRQRHGCLHVPTVVFTTAVHQNPAFVRCYHTLDRRKNTGASWGLKSTRWNEVKQVSLRLYSSGYLIC